MGISQLYPYWFLVLFHCCLQTYFICFLLTLLKSALWHIEDLLWWLFHGRFRRMCILLLMDVVIYKCQKDKLTVLFRFLISFLFFCPLNQLLPKTCWSLQRNSGFVYFSFYFFQLLSHGSWHSTVRGIYVDDCYTCLNKWPFIILQWDWSCLTIHLLLKSASPKINKASPTIFWLVLLACYVFINHLTLILSKYFNLKVSGRHLVQSCFLYPFSLFSFKPFTLKMINFLDNYLPRLQLS